MNPFVPLLPRLPAEAERHWPGANAQLLWGWKRDHGGSSRLVFYTGRLARQGDALGVTDQYLLYVHRTDRATAAGHAATLRDAADRIEPVLGPLAVDVRRTGRTSAVVEATVGTPSTAALALTARLRRRRPRRAIAPVPEVAAAPLVDLVRHLPADLYLGSGMSYEAGLPTLCDMHDAFGVDDPTGSFFATGPDDPLPARLAGDPLGAVAGFCQVHTGAVLAEPSPAMRTVAELRDAGLIGDVYTDNVDNLMVKVGVPFERTRGSGVLNERHAVALPSPTLVVVGVAADRRQVVQQARARRRRVVVVNPCLKVAPHVRHLTYLREGDAFHRTTADAFFGAVAREVGLDGAAAGLAA
jgi:hypothetical protein